MQIELVDSENPLAVLLSEYDRSDLDISDVTGKRFQSTATYYGNAGDKFRTHSVSP